MSDERTTKVPVGWRSHREDCTIVQTTLFEIWEAEAQERWRQSFKERR